ncbi:alpha/beta hydrolase [Xanthomonas vesicatoria ATCC 35937]|uniref:Putative hydrolase or acyltransferase of alpha/beta superfamily n=1 Tax=Xanthomonas vesicatoria ATCC 35937 TaxID=925775 RepID=F0BIK8_9XANT|nr:alpha/beta hydrolase [Xanthomonas vesicatoria]APP75682.1 alpha/beta hydrolase [Xanthomonas vesicatoria ATCC 35937]EGD07690.1 putative hydrolase or acyltransferase of alpha/beta superfamily [Xanthomonas vesicatoria ATCC 35937]KTF35241.1 cysteine protease [Xanthomonas vesicatoria]MCC8598617.1 alpha/beta hydrolase [Xanthomonas vesicatoria]MCC8604723.1 alpha/beta hydrolase [Xanthomonas vesicatoria]
MLKHVTMVAALLGALLAAGCERTQAPAAEKADAAASVAAATPPAATPSPGSAAGHHYGGLQFMPCTLSSGSAAGNIEAQCAQLQVAENPAAPKGRQIALKIAWLESDAGGGTTQDPVFFIAGGPGQSATEVSAIAAAALREVRKTRDIILVDQRGTGGSHPLRCDHTDGTPLQAEISSNPEAMLAYVRQCALALSAYADPRYYTTAEAIGDLDAVRAALGVPQIDLVGVSYGTRVAQHYARRYPSHTRAIVLDGVAPSDLVISGEFARTFEDALTLQAAQCRSNPACHARFPTEVRAQLRSIMERLRKESPEVDYRDLRTNAVKRDRVTADAVIGLAFMFSYAPQSAALLPLVLDEAAAGRYAPLMALSHMDMQINQPMQWSVVCAEDADRYRPSAAQQALLLGDEVPRSVFAACPVWPTGKRAADFTAPLRSQVPALLLSGQLDPVTPPRYAEVVLKGLPNGRHLVAPRQGHSVMALGCMPKLMAQFLESTDARALDTRCVADLSAVPAFTSFNGWEP